MLPVQICSLRLRIWTTRSTDSHTLVVVEASPLEGATERVHTARDKAGLMSAIVRSAASCNSGCSGRTAQSALTRSVSSMRRSHLPPHLRARRWLNSAVRSPPRWRYPVGEGANLSLAFCGTAPAAFSGARCWCDACVECSLHRRGETSLKLRVAVLMVYLGGRHNNRPHTGPTFRTLISRTDTETGPFSGVPREIHGTGVPESGDLTFYVYATC